MTEKARQFILLKKKNEAEDIVSLFFQSKDGKKFSFVAGQYVNVENEKGRSKCYTISSQPGEKWVCLTVKKQGEMSSDLVGSEIGRVLTFTGPYGHFYPQEGQNNLVLLAGGIGITPFISFIRDTLPNGSKRTTHLFYSNKNISGTAFFDELKDFEKKHDNLKVTFTLTGETNKVSGVDEYARIDSKMLKKHLKDLNKKTYYICGPISFVNDMWKTLRGLKVEEKNIYTEAFY